MCAQLCHMQISNIKQIKPAIPSKKKIEKRTFHNSYFHFVVSILFLKNVPHCIHFRPSFFFWNATSDWERVVTRVRRRPGVTCLLLGQLQGFHWQKTLHHALAFIQFAFFHQVIWKCIQFNSPMPFSIHYYSFPGIHLINDHIVWG